MLIINYAHSRNWLRKTCCCGALSFCYALYGARTSLAHSLIVALNGIGQNIVTIVLLNLIVYQQISPEANNPEHFLLV